MTLGGFYKLLYVYGVWAAYMSAHDVHAVSALRARKKTSDFLELDL